MTVNALIIIVTVIALFTGFVLIGLRRRSDTPIERKPPPRRDRDA